MWLSMLVGMFVPFAFVGMHARDFRFSFHIVAQLFFTPRAYSAHIVLAQVVLCSLRIHCATQACVGFEGLRRFELMKRKAAASNPKSEAANKTRAVDLVDLHRGPHMSQRALASTLSKVRERGVPASSSATSQWRARKKPPAKRRHTGAASSTLICLCGTVPTKSPLSTRLRCSIARSTSATSFAACFWQLMRGGPPAWSDLGT